MKTASKETQVKPATALPWRDDEDTAPVMLVGIMGGRIGEVEAEGDAAYIVAACNAYPELVAALRELMLRCDGEEGVRADGSNIQTIRASALLERLGEE